MSTLWMTDELAKEIKELRLDGNTWDEVSYVLNEKYLGVLYDTRKTENAVRKAYSRTGVGDFEETTYVDNVKKSIQARTAAAKLRKENKVIVDNIIKAEDAIKAVTDIINSSSIKKLKLPKPPKVNKQKKNMIMEALISDVHYGKITGTFDLKTCRSRMQKLSDTFIQEYKNYSKTFNVTGFVIGLLGDIIESETMHGSESSRSSEFGNSQQIMEAINSLFFDLLLPIAGLGVTVTVPCVTGNHDRTEHNRTYNYPGKHNVTWIIYNSLRLLCKQTGLKNVKFIIPEGPYCKHSIFDDLVLYEHYDAVKGGHTRKAMEGHMNNRSKQLGQLITFMRGGHFHEYTQYGRGTIIINGSVCGQDSYADVHGYMSEACQVINYYVKSNTRPNSFYHSFAVYLD
jgi:hypothetical protein